jgi:hypothetical protein
MGLGDEQDDRCNASVNAIKRIFEFSAAWIGADVPAAGCARASPSQQHSCHLDSIDEMPDQQIRHPVVSYLTYQDL